jgi:hydrogenase maturation protease
MVLVIGVGNPTRRDDGAGLRLASRLEEEGWPGVECRCLQQLDTTLLEEIRDLDVLVVADADPRCRRTALEEVREDLGASSSHGLSPGALKGMCRALTGRAPEVWVCRLPALDLGFGEGLSPATEAAVGEGLALLKGFLVGREAPAGAS